MARHRIRPGAITIDLPNMVQQKDYSCGASALQAICAYHGVGPGEEWAIVDDLGMDRRIGSHPFQIARTARRYGLSVAEHQPMSDAQLIRYLRRRVPVLIMLQAWGERRDYTDDWIDGHWVVAIGHDRAGVFFEDPSLESARGFIPFAALDARWHDVGPHGVHLERYGMAIWKRGARRSSYRDWAQSID